MCLEQGIETAEAEGPFSTSVSMTAVSSSPAVQTLIHRPLRDKCQRLRVCLEPKG